MQPLAISVVGGLTMSTMLTLIVVPCAYLIVHGLAGSLRRIVVGAPRAPEVRPSPAASGGR
jgi:hypothetical protein